jgi:4-amino-4-deoxy-L-arabinose transferase-like glycosyltransferase
MTKASAPTPRTPNSATDVPGRSVSSMPNRKLRWGLLCLGLLILFLFKVGDRGLNEPDEGRYADIATELLEADSSWLEPRMSDLGHYDKPPLIYWVTAISFKLLGVNEWSARLPSFLGAILTLIGLAWASWRLYNEETSWHAVIIAGTLAHLWILARFLTPDMLLTGWCTLALAAWTESRHQGGKWNWWILSALFWILAWWTKATPTSWASISPKTLPD